MDVDVAFVCDRWWLPEDLCNFGAWLQNTAIGLDDIAYTVSGRVIGLLSLGWSLLTWNGFDLLKSGSVSLGLCLWMKNSTISSAFSSKSVSLKHRQRNLRNWEDGMLFFSCWGCGKNCSPGKSGNRLLCNERMLLVSLVSGKRPCPRMRPTVQRFRTWTLWQDGSSAQTCWSPETDCDALMLCQYRHRYIFCTSQALVCCSVGAAFVQSVP